MEPRELSTEIDQPSPGHATRRWSVCGAWRWNGFECLIPAICVALIAWLASQMDQIVRLDQLRGVVPDMSVLLDAKGVADWATVGKGAWLAARVVWSFATTAYVVVCFAAIWTCREIIHSIRTEPSLQCHPSVRQLIRRLWQGWIWLLLLSAPVGVLNNYGSNTFNVQLIDETDMALEQLAGGCLSTPQVYVSILSYLEFTTCAILAAAACFLLVPAVVRDIRKDAIRREVAELAGQRRQLQALLFMGMLVLVFSVFQLASVHSWVRARVAAAESVTRYRTEEAARKNAAASPGNHGRIASDWKVENGRLHLAIAVPPNTTATVHVPAVDNARPTASQQDSGRRSKGGGIREVETLTNALLNARAMYATLMLAALYFPASAILMKRARDISACIRGTRDTPGLNANSEFDDLLNKQDLAFDLQSLLPKFAAIIAPILAGLASHLPSVLQALVQ